MNQDQNSGSTGQSGIDQETERRNSENETGQQSQSGQLMQGDTSGGQSSQSGQASQSGQSGQSPAGGQADAGQPGSEGGSGFVGSSDDTSSDYLTKGENQDFAPEGQGASNAGESDIETGQSSNADSTLDDGSDISE